MTQNFFNIECTANIGDLAGELLRNHPTVVKKIICSAGCLNDSDIMPCLIINYNILAEENFKAKIEETILQNVLHKKCHMGCGGYLKSTIDSLGRLFNI